MVLQRASEGRTVLSTPKRRKMGSAQWWPAAHRNAFLIQRHAHILGAKLVQNERDHSGLLARGSKSRAGRAPPSAPRWRIAEQPVLLVVDQFSLLTFLDFLNVEPQLFLDLIVRAAVQIGDAGVHIELARRQLIITLPR